MVYRGERGALRTAPADGGFLDEIVHQFADSYAFARELVQNAIDAGATRVSVAVEEVDDLVYTSVTDDGAGMTLATLEGPLLTAFSSGKEGQPGKIGRYGVGFLSVFALDPVRVLVATHRAEGAHVVTLASDRTYTIEADAPAEGTGTTVTLELRMQPPDRDKHRERLEAALSKYCEHVRVELTLSTISGTKRLDRPFGIDSVVTVTETHGDMSVSVGVANEASHGARFYHSGLLLFETVASPPAIAGVAFKVESASFTHTISRDGIRGDRAYKHAVDLAESLARVRLPRAVGEALAAAAQSDDTSDAAIDRYAGLLAALSREDDLRHVRLRLAMPDSSRRSVSFSEAREAKLAGARAPSPLVELLVREGHTVLLLDERGVVESFLSRTMIRSVRQSHESEIALFREPADDGRVRLANLVRAALQSCGYALETVECVRAEGVATSRVSWFAPKPATELVSGSSGWLFRRTEGTSARLLLLATSPPVAAALAARDLRPAAALVARLALLETFGTPSRELNEKLLTWAATRQVGADEAAR